MLDQLHLHRIKVKLTINFYVRLNMKFKSRNKHKRNLSIKYKWKMNKVFKILKENKVELRAIKAFDLLSSKDQSSIL